MDTDILKQEFHYYIENQNELVKQYDGKFLVIKNASVKNSFDTFEEAIKWAYNTLELGTFIIQECTEGEDAYTETFHSQLIFS